MNSSSVRLNYCQRLPSTRVCKFYQRGFCKFGNRCRNVHPETQGCVVSPKSSWNTNEDGSSKMICGICFDVVKQKKDRRRQLFGILPNCNHCFCFACIRRWRQSKDFDLSVAKGCPECRTLSDYVFSSKVWFHRKEEKDSFISKEKFRMQSIDCRYFRKGRGKCPFGNKCLYLHALPNSKRMDVGPPRRCRTSDNLEFDVVHEILHLLREDDGDDDFFDSDLDDSTFALQLYGRRDVRRIIAVERLTSQNSDTDEFDCTLFL